MDGPLRGGGAVALRLGRVEGGLQRQKHSETGKC